MIERWGHFLVRRAGLVVAAGAFGAGVFDSLSQGGFEDPGSESKRALLVDANIVRAMLVRVTI